jgi:hypothetical protein
MNRKIVGQNLNFFLDDLINSFKQKTVA